MHKSDKFIAWFLVFQAVSGAAVFGWVALHSPIPLGAWFVIVPLIALAAVAGIWSLKQRQWAAILGIVVFAIQTPIIAVPHFQFSAWLGMHIDLAATWTGQAVLGVNAVGLAMFILSNWRYSAPNKSFKPNSLRESA